MCSAMNDQYCSAIITNAPGEAIVAWFDGRSGTDYDIYAQRVDVSGLVQWTADGVILCAATGILESSPMIPDGAGGAIITWTKVINYQADIYAQRINASGVLLWAPEGIVVSAAALNQNLPAIVSDGAGKGIVTWPVARSFPESSEDIYAQRVNAYGMIPSAVDATTSSLLVTVGGNYPNPFFAGTAFAVTLRHDAEIKLEVFDAVGRRVRAMTLGRLGAGLSRVAFDGRDDDAHALPSGVYFSRLRAGAETVTKKMVITR